MLTITVCIRRELPGDIHWLGTRGGYSMGYFNLIIDTSVWIKSFFFKMYDFSLPPVIKSSSGGMLICRNLTVTAVDISPQIVVKTLSILTNFYNSVRPCLWGSVTNNMSTLHTVTPIQYKQDFTDIIFGYEGLWYNSNLNSELSSLIHPIIIISCCSDAANWCIIVLSA